MSALRVGFELTALELDTAGTARAVRGLWNAMAERDDVNIVELRHPGPGPQHGALGRIVRGLGRELRWFGRGLPQAARGVDVLHCPAALGPARRVRPPLVVVSVHDLLAFEHPGWHTRANALQQRLAMPRLVRRATEVVCPSAWTRDRLRARLGTDARVVPWGVGAPFSPGEVDEAVLARHGIALPYVLAVGTLQPRKGLEAFACLPAEYRVVVAGGRGWRDQPIMERLQGRAVFTGRVADSDLVALLRGAEALVFPSAHEGFGFPPLEAMACGTPVVALRAAAIPEVVGDAAELAAPDDPAALSVALERVLGSSDRRTQLRAAGLARAAELSWVHCADAYASIYRAAARA